MDKDNKFGRKDERNLLVWKDVMSGLSYIKAGKIHNLSSGRVQQITDDVMNHPQIRGFEKVTNCLFEYSNLKNYRKTYKWLQQFKELL